MSRKSSLYDDLADSDSLVHSDGDPYAALWRAVLMQAFFDMTCTYFPKKTRHLKHQAATYLTHHSRDLHTVCDYAGVHPDEIVKRARAVAPPPAPPPRRPQRPIIMNNYRLTLLSLSAAKSIERHVR